MLMTVDVFGLPTFCILAMSKKCVKKKDGAGIEKMLSLIHIRCIIHRTKNVKSHQSSLYQYKQKLS